MRFRIRIEQDEDCMFVAQCPTLPGCISQGKTRQEAIVNIKDAIKGYLESLQKHNEPIPVSSLYFMVAKERKGRLRPPSEPPARGPVPLTPSY
ncbi:MAG: type II toxin-antitoxin system HicB family antitoxin [Magnetococcales bacterium]|uniref:Type II toxin-antitoxin system HicB family antitoxin n=1 Tax=Candidatus Magnetobacterium casense TaxID=1455061 RepID=A0ABS6RYI0_9BACT|nr:type II toxin-antitoxin system HicB family antitoxin [Candidatus Magnetobacterium casensis]MBF0609401.1 type II toxin-antitoxin system HicB family antitoxin [Nitrospirota bacterium]MBV6341661.1 type II toxin-antitoxin system HicB family antitoxin [Candidatus Magnetobacterium casensis]